MSLLCDCPAGAEIVDVPIDSCPENFGQPQKAIFQRIFKTASAKNEFLVASADPKVKASWTPLLAASDGTKVVQSPYITAPTNEAGAARKFGGGNETLGGIELTIGREPSTFTANLLAISQKTIKALKKLSCEGALGIYLVDEFGRMMMLTDNQTTPTKYMPIPIHSLFIGDKALGGLEKPDMNVLSFSLMPNWSDDTIIITPTDFNALTDLVTP